MDNSKEIKELYEEFCIKYDKHMKKTGHYLAQEKIIKKIIDDIEEPILDLACGSGFLIKQLSKHFSKVQANDFSKEILKLAKIECPDTKFTNDNAETLPSYNQKFNSIISCNLFFYIKNRNKTIKRWRELLNKNGKMIFIEEYPFIKPQKHEVDEFSNKLMELLKPISPEEIIDLMAQNDFKLVKKEKVAIDNKHDLYGLVFKL